MGEPKQDNRRSFDRFDVTWKVDCTTEDTFLYASIANISQMGIFVSTREPLAIGTRLVLAFTPNGGGGGDHEPFKIEGEVTWVNAVKANGDNPNPGMGVRFVDLALEERERLVELVRTIALREQS